MLDLRHVCPEGLETLERRLGERIGRTRSVVVDGMPGQVRSEVLAAAVALAADRTVVWVDPGQGGVPLMRPLTAGADPVPLDSASLRSIVDGAPAMLVLEDLDSLAAAAQEELLDTLRELRWNDLVVVLGVFGAAAEAHSRRALGRLDRPDFLRVDGAPREALARAVRGWAPELAEERVDALVAAAQGCRELAWRMAVRAGRGVDPLDAEAWEAALQHAVVDHLLGPWGALFPEVRSFAVVRALLGPHADAARAADALGMGRAAAGHAQEVCRVTGLRGENADRARRALLTCVGLAGFVAETECVVQLLVRREAPAEWIVDLLEAIAPDDGRLLDVVARGVRETLAAQDLPAALDLFRRAERAVEDRRLIDPLLAQLTEAAFALDWDVADHLLRHTADCPGHLSLMDPDRIPLAFGMEHPRTVLALAEDGRPVDAVELARVLHCWRWLAGGEAEPAPAADDDLLPELARVLHGALAGERVEDLVPRLASAVEELPGSHGASRGAALMIACLRLLLIDPAGAVHWCDRASFTSAGDPAGRAFADLIRAQALLRGGDLDAALEAAVAAAARFTRLRAPRLAYWSALTEAHVRLERGEDVALEDEPEGCHPWLTVYGDYVRARREEVRGHAQAAVEGLFAVGRRLESLGIAHPGLLHWRPHLELLFRAGGEPALASTVRREHRRSLTAWHRRNPQAAARLAAALGTALEDPVAEPGGPAGAPGHDGDDRRAPVESTVGGGARPELAERVVGATVELALAVAGAATSPVEHPPAEPAPLSPAELRVVRLVVTGMSNRDVARALYLSKRTVDTHLGNVYRKLGLSSRAELKARLADVGEGGPRTAEHEVPAAAETLPYG